MPQPTKPRDTTSDAMAAGGALHGQAEGAQAAAYAQAAPTFTDADPVIRNNAAGGAGYFAEAHHTASFNVDAGAKERGEHAERLGSTAFGSPDIRMDDGSTYNPKYYSTAEASYSAGAEVAQDDAGWQAKYAGQTILVPSDQLHDIQDLHARDIAAAQAAGDHTRVEALNSIQFRDHIDHQGVQSQPLSYAEAHQGADHFRDGVLPAYAGEDTNALEAGAEAGLLSAVIALATTLGPGLIGDLRKLHAKELTKDQVTHRLAAALAEARTSIALGWSAARGGGAGAIGMMAEGIDPFGVAALVNVSVDTIQLALQMRRGEMSKQEFGAELWKRTQDRIFYTGVTALACYFMGPAGLLVPILLRRCIPDADLQQQAVHAWHEVAQHMQRQVQLRIQAAQAFDATRHHLRNAQAHADASGHAFRQAAVNLRIVQSQLNLPAPFILGDLGKS
jgi:hypothetical protein